MDNSWFSSTSRSRTPFTGLMTSRSTSSARCMLLSWSSLSWRPFRTRSLRSYWSLVAFVGWRTICVFPLHFVAVARSIVTLASMIQTSSMSVVSVEVETQMVTVDKDIQVSTKSNKLLGTENRTSWHRTPNNEHDRARIAAYTLLEWLCPICQLGIEPVQHRSLDTETPTKNFQQCIVVDRIERGAEIEQYGDRGIAGVDVVHGFIADGCDCIIGRVVGLISQLMRRQLTLSLDVIWETCSDDALDSLWDVTQNTIAQLWSRTWC